jgi:hypothetical protein
VGSPFPGFRDGQGTGDRDGPSKEDSSQTCRSKEDGCSQTRRQEDDSSGQTCAAKKTAAVKLAAKAVQPMPASQRAAAVRTNLGASQKLRDFLDGAGWD